MSDFNITGEEQAWRRGELERYRRGDMRVEPPGRVIALPIRNGKFVGFPSHRTLAEVYGIPKSPYAGQ